MRFGRKPKYCSECGLDLEEVLVNSLNGQKIYLTLRCPLWLKEPPIGGHYYKVLKETKRVPNYNIYTGEKVGS